MNDSRDDSNTKGSGPPDQTDEVYRLEQVATWFERARLADDRDSLLAKIEDPGVRQEVLSLLAIHDRESDETPLIRDDELAAVAHDWVETHDPEPTPEPPPAIPGWRTVHPLGRGGMGTVWLCERPTDDFVQRGAVKVLRSGQDNAELLRRFRLERRLLAQLDHPNIATVLDAGTTTDGRPFVVLEHVDGPDLIRFAEEQRLGTRERIGLFVRICTAVEHAHTALVVHRDLKPSNILVARKDGEPKLLDFGIAKLLEGHDDLNASLGGRTGTGYLLMTPEYASPEQVRGTDVIRTTTDVYALGLVLYELLTGRRAQEISNPSPTELARVICEVSPQSPSNAVPTEPRLRRALAGDLDAIVMKALRKEPESRYASVAEFAADLRRHLGGLPVQARRGTKGYAMRRFVRRNRGPLSAAALVFLLSLGASIALYLQSERLRDQRNLARSESTRANEQSAKAQQQARVATQVSDFLIELFDLPEAQSTRPDAMTARDILRRGARRIDTSIEDDPLVRAELMEVLARASASTGDLDQAEKLVLEASSLLRGIEAELPEFNALRSTASIRRQQGRYEEALTALARAERILDQLRESDIPERALRINEGMLLLTRADTTFEFGRPDQAREAIDRALQLLGGGEFRAEQKLYSSALFLSSRLLLEEGKWNEAGETIDEAIEIAIAIDRPLERAEYLRTRAEIEFEKGQLEKSLASYETSARLVAETFGEAHPLTDESTYGIAKLLRSLDRIQEAQDILIPLVDRERARYGDHPLTALAISQLAGTYSVQGNPSRAIELLEECLRMQRKVYEEDHFELANTLSNLGVAWRRVPDIEKAAPLFKEALQMRLRLLDEKHPAVLTSRSLMALVHLERGDLDRAFDEYLAVYEARREVLGEHPQTAGALFSLAVAHYRKGELGEAEERVRESIRIYEATLSPEQRLDLSRPLGLLAGIYNRRGATDDAERILRQNLTLFRELKLPGEFRRVRATQQLVSVLAGRGNLDDALQLIDEEIEAIESKPEHSRELLEELQNGRKQVRAGMERR